MHPELLNNSLFLKYYKQWQEDPNSIVFASIAEYFLKYGLIDDALAVCRKGLKRHPSLVSGRLVLAKIHLKRGNWEEAEDELRAALMIMPENRSALELARQVAEQKISETLLERKEQKTVPLVVDTTESDEGSPLLSNPSWSTVTMARIFAAQGYYDKARGIYNNILRSEPDNEEALKGLDVLKREAEASKLEPAL